MLPKKRYAPTTRSKSKQPRASGLIEETAKSVVTMPPPNLMIVVVQALSTTVSLTVTPAVREALGQVSSPVTTENELVEALVQEEIYVLTEGTATMFMAQPLALPSKPK